MLKPPKLKKGDTVGICSPSGTIAHKQSQFKQAIVNFEQATGLKVFVTPHASQQHHYSAGKPAERLADFHSLVANPDIKAIIFSAGGDTAIDLVDQLDYDLIAQNPKIITGISDATTLLSAITAKTKLITFLGIEFLDFATHDKQYELSYLKKAWFDGTIGEIKNNPQWCDLKHTPTNYKQWQTIRGGSAEGQLMGGNSESFIQLLDTPYALFFPESILFLETYKLPKKKIHKTLMQLRLRNVFEKTNGIILGYCLACDDPAVVGNEQSLLDLALAATTGYDFPIIHVGEMGHCVENVLQPLGALIQIDATNLHIAIQETVTE